MTSLQIILLLLVLLCEGILCIALLSGLTSRLSRELERRRIREQRNREAYKKAIARMKRPVVQVIVEENGASERKG